MSNRFALNDPSVVVVIGSGAAGGTVSHELAQRGINVVCLEAGQRLSLTDVVHDTKIMDERLSWHDEIQGASTWLCKTVGGTTMRWAGVAPRLTGNELAALTNYGPLNNSNLVDWPISIEELVPYYELAEKKMGVSGLHGLPPSAQTSNFKVLKAAGEKIGYREITNAGIAINSVDHDGRPACTQLGFCFSGCASGAKWSTLYTEIPKAEDTGRFELRSGCMAVRINHDSQGNATGVVYIDGNNVEHEQKARVVCVAGNVHGTTRLLLSSESTLFPDGMANSSGLVGKNFMRHMSTYIYGVMPGEVGFHKGARATGIVYDERYHQPARGFVGGYLLEAVSWDPKAMAKMAGWGEPAREIMENYNRLAGIWAVGEDPPQESNMVRLHPSKRDQYGLAVPIMDYRFHPNTLAMKKHAQQQARAMLLSLGATDVRDTGMDIEQSCHLMGVARMSKNPDTGVTNEWGQTHDVGNVFVSDGSVFPTSGSANPTLTIVALAIRQAEHIASKMARKEL